MSDSVIRHHIIKLKTQATPHPMPGPAANLAACAVFEPFGAEPAMPRKSLGVALKIGIVRV